MTATTARYTHDEIYAMSDFAAEGLPPAAARTARLLVENTAQEMNRIDEAIGGKVISLRTALDRIERKLDAHDSMNELGELQRIPVEIDQLIAQRAVHRRTLATLTQSSSPPKPGDCTPPAV